MGYINSPSISFRPLHLHHYRPLERDLSASLLSSTYSTISLCLHLSDVGLFFLTLTVTKGSHQDTKNRLVQDSDFRRGASFVLRSFR